MKLIFYTFCFFSICVIQGQSYSFNFEPPCTPENTAFLSLRNPRLPAETVKCVDVKSLGSQVIPTHVELINSTVSLHADHMLLKIIPMHITEVLPELERADFTGNRIRHMDPTTFRKNPKLKTLLLSENNIIILKKQPLLKQASLTTLHLGKNKIKRLSPATFRGLPELTQLYLDGNLLIRVHPKVFSSLEKLTYLHLGNNRLKFIPPRSVLPKSLVNYITKGNSANSTKINEKP